jgi:hypothetical protein
VVAVRRGAELLDERYPGDWRNLLVQLCGEDLETLQVARADHCVLRELYSSYPIGLAMLEVLSEDARDYGFNSLPREQGQLRAAWRAEVHQRETVGV